jgi:hypothetical protein
MMAQNGHGFAAGGTLGWQYSRVELESRPLTLAVYLLAGDLALIGTDLLLKWWWPARCAFEERRALHTPAKLLKFFGVCVLLPLLVYIS